MFKSFFKTIIIAQQAAAAVKVLDHMTDAQLFELGHTRASFVENIKNDFIASREVEAAAKQNHAPVNANLAGAF
jgi:Na+-transporting NADH:ubiquinone oxidoreductase subunit NqrD